MIEWTCCVCGFKFKEIDFDLDEKMCIEGLEGEEDEI